MTVPDAIVALDCRVTVLTRRPAASIAVLAAASVWPTTFGTGTPIETTRLTAVPGLRSAPTVGDWATTLPIRLVLFCSVTVPTTRPALVRAAVASAMVMPRRSGTSVVAQRVKSAIAAP